ncbi:MAG: 3-oxoacyl-ACP reductase FabG [Paenibacillus dendritiformis]|uniref:3-oxoacyl-ACP reductase FabG n=1 Tax=Paenibacillus dendritiformis TaxID=130049 RepID=UPI001B09B290|nr:3-oxoacyl-ACP reductase FabG [Paenibacillus dendritiformis]MDU5141695.1 3-oxoacyl-ACP reductase FabG [Paenibacillus dendritiformis]GIO71858.1 beta-ketoacyl-ACP reductase [Paenibacillus dendritiformis]
MKLEGKTAIITGGANGIGEAAVRLFLDAGANVVIADFNEEAGRRLLQDLGPSAAERALFAACNVADPASVEQLVAKTLERFGAIEVLINNAGITRDAMLLKMSPEQWRDVIDVNLTGVFHCTRHAAPYMAAQGRGKIINTASIVGVQGNIGQTNYAAAKAGVIGMTKTWARELGYKGICVNAVAPGFIATEMVAKMPENIVDAMRNKVPLRRLGQPEDVAQVYLFLASAAADYINGAVIEVNGGLSI